MSQYVLIDLERLREKMDDIFSPVIDAETGKRTQNSIAKTTAKTKMIDAIFSSVRSGE